MDKKHDAYKSIPDPTKRHPTSWDHTDVRNHNRQVQKRGWAKLSDAENNLKK